ncbi:SusC/RagA family TonB-linked outer membrane protein [Arcticibacter eurypsychrophilus]|uniref:SusC/RagA family TonB-linked outer membrane protein n=1 Tax=Arcticibacter eurypsychrophilus TaxID=1434752 RepID=UPI00084DAB72|nr:SusC/RagA family TonB-linked outer membrane protein [Arcticibacter eurypsychrophilus]
MIIYIKTRTEVFKSWCVGLLIAALGLFTVFVPARALANNSVKGSQPAYQTKEVEGRVTDNNGNGIAKVSVKIKGTQIAVATDSNGHYKLKLTDQTSVLVFSMVGLVTQEINVGSRNQIDVTLEEDILGLKEVVVTALGISREKKSLGYSTQQIEGKSLNEAPSSNFINNLAGKIAGANIVSGGAVGSSARITLRGESSLSMQNNQPLFIIDGAPVANDGVNNTSGNADYGSSTAAINPADVASVNVLKGPAAAALYGSRAANGAIVITTKQGSSGKGSGISFNSYYFINDVGRLPQFQNEFGAGRGGKYSGSNFGASWSAYPDGVQDGFDESWGPRLDVGTNEAQFDSPTSNGFRGADVALSNRGDIIATPWVSQPDNIRDFFETGGKAYNNIAFSGSNEKSKYRLSLTSLNEKGIVPNNDLDRYQVSLNSSYRLTNKLTTGIHMNYAKTESTNRPDNGYGRNTAMYFFTWMNRNINMNSLKDYWQTGLEGLRQFQYNYGENHNNPFFLMYEDTKGQDKNQVYGNIDLNYEISKNLSLKLRTALDYYNDFRPMRWAVSDLDNAEGKYEEVKIEFMERNSDFLLSYHNTASEGDFKYQVSLGGNRFDLSGNSGSTTAPSLLIPGIYNLGNTGAQLSASSSRYQKRINSMYATTNLSFKDVIFMDITGRNDWSSTLPQGNNSYFYPSVGLNTDLKKILSLPDAFSQGQLRASWAQVGNDAGPYQLYNTYNYSAPWGNNAALAGQSGLANAALKPELTSTYEIGTVWGFFDRFSVDLTYYDIRSKNQIMSLPQVTSSGYTSRAINAGEIKNNGVEIMLSATPINKPGSLRWDMSVNWAKNIGKVISLTDEVDKVVQSAPGEEASIQARVGERMGAIWGPGYMRVPDGAMKGDVIIYENGRARATGADIYLGNINPDWTGSFSSQMKYKNISLNMLIAGQVGGKFVSRFYNKAVGAGQLIESAEGRSAREVGKEYDTPYYISGAAIMADGSYQPNSSSTDGTFSQGIYGTDIRGFFKGRMDHITEAQLFSTTYFKLRELSLGYNLPAKWLQRSFLSNAKVALTGRNLFLWTPSSNKHFDPEVAVATQGNGLVPGFEDMSLPSMKEFGISLNLNF